MMAFYVGGLLDLPPEEYRAKMDAAMDAVREAGGKMIAAEKARKPDPRSDLTYRAYRTMKLVAVVMVKHSDRADTVQVSRDGDAKGKHAFPRKEWLDVQPESAGPFVLALISKRNLAWMQRPEKQGVNLAGVVPDLVGDWTDEDRATWRRLREAADHINVCIRSAGNRRSALTRNQAA